MRITLGTVLLFALSSACTRDAGSDRSNSAPSPYPLGQALVIGESPEGELVTVSGSCGSEVCRAVRERCGEPAYAEVVVGGDGAVLDVVCFRANARIQEVGPGEVATASAGNDTVLVLDDANDGLDVRGDVVLAGNNAVLYGRGADLSRIGGGVIIEKNNAVVRGVSIGGDVRIDKNNAQLSFVEILGDLTISGNNTTLAGSTVHGRVIIEGVNTVLVHNRFFGVSALAGKNLECNGNVSASAADVPESDAGASDAQAAAPESDAGVETPLECRDVQGPPGGRDRR